MRLNDGWVQGRRLGLGIEMLVRELKKKKSENKRIYNF